MNNSFHINLNKAIQESNNGRQDIAIGLLLQCEKTQLQLDYVHLNLANCYIKKNDDNSASKYFKKILSNNPQDEQILLHLNKLALAIFRFDIALQACEIAEKIAPKSADVLAALIQAKKEARKRSGVKSLCKRIISLFPDNSWSYSQLGYNYLTSGKFNSAQKAFQKAISLDPNSSFVYAGLVKATKFKQNPRVLINKIDQAIDENQEGEAKARLYLSKAKIFNDCGNFEKAWVEAEKGKKIKANLSAFQPEKFNVHIQKIMDYYSDENNFEFSDNSSSHICIVGMPRSGTTLIEQILSTYLEFYPGGETPALDNAFYHQFKGESYIYQEHPLNSEDLNAMAKDYESFFKRFSNFSGSRIIDKIPMHFLHIGIYMQMFPNAKVINFHRDKYDVSTSIFFENFNIRQNFTHNIVDIFCVYESYKILMAFWQKKYPNSFLTVEYSEFVTQHSKVKKQILDFVGITTSSEVDYKSSRNAIETPSVWQARQPIYESSVNRWKRYPQMVDFYNKDTKLF
jgi:tetratricopeptide (TPR) repeat protein